MEPITIMDRSTVLQITYNEMVKYHGRLHIGGVALAYQVLRLAFAILLPGGIPDREKVGFLSGLGESGRGVIDGVEMVTRARSRGALLLDLDRVRNKPGPEAPNGGRYFFEVDYDGRRVGLALKSGLITAEFTLLSRAAKAGGMTAAETDRLTALREGLATLLLSREPAEWFDVVRC
jgi:hypothetical protein